jgi:hypothetical protein
MRDYLNNGGSNVLWANAFRNYLKAYNELNALL